MLGEVRMPQDAVQLAERYLSEDSSKWARLASNLQWRRLQILLLREILLELRKLNGARTECEG
jgi:hypothetical protein